MLADDVHIQFAAVIAAQERSEAVLSYFGIDVGNKIGTPEKHRYIVIAEEVV